MVNCVVTDQKEALSMFSDAERYPFIPRRLPTYAEACILNGRSNRLTGAVECKNLKVFEAINRMFQLACEATGLKPDELLRKTDFHPRDMSSTRLDSAFAEIRAVNFLAEEGFTNLRLLPAGKKKRADILGTLNGKLFAIEVANSIFDADKRVEPPQLADWLIGRVSSQSHF